MSEKRYHQEGEAFVIDDYRHAKTFASFLPAVAGSDGKPLWAFYCNAGQAVSSFGVESKDTPITPFDSATLAYQNIALKSFRTFLRVNKEMHYPFFEDGNAERMEIHKDRIKIVSEGFGIRLEIVYSTVSHRPYAALIRRMTLTNISGSPLDVEGLDGLPIYFPHGLSNFCYKELVSLMAAYCIVRGVDESLPFVKFKTSTGDNPIVTEAISGNGFYAVDEEGAFLHPIVDPDLVFGGDLSLLSPKGFIAEDYDSFVKEQGQTENKLPCAFYSFKKHLAPGEKTEIAALFGMWESEERFLSSAKDFSVSIADTMIQETYDLIDSLTYPASIKTADRLFDKYVKQTYLDNNLRGGFPTNLGSEDNPVPYYLYSRKHGDMERDYNQFRIPSEYYSSGPGNFRDVNQNRRSDLLFTPYIKDYNIRIFFSLIQADGQNPLNVAPPSFSYAGEPPQTFSALNEEAKKRAERLLRHYRPSELYAFLLDDLQLERERAQTVFQAIIAESHQSVEANFAEGYWVDHWTYNVDLLENYSSIYPDQEEELFFGSEYRYFYSPVYVEPREEKYCLLPDGKIRQYGAIDLKKLKDDCEKRGFDIKKTAYLQDEDGHEIKTNLASKIVNLIVIKFSTLDAEQMGIEMECEKPGWNDAMNGLPGLFASAMSESVELLRLSRYAIEHLAPFAEKPLILMEEQADFLGKISALLGSFMKKEISSFEYWDKATSAREAFRLCIKERASGQMRNVPVADVLPLLKDIAATLEEGIAKAKKTGGGILPSYIIHRPTDYVVTGHVNHLGYKTVKVTGFSSEFLPPFLEASARAFKLGQRMMGVHEYEAIKKTDLYDPKLRFYKTCAALDEAPFEIGRVHAFTKGWLERECNFLHMSYKYMLGLLKAGLYEQFYQEIKTNLVCFMDPEVYGRDPAEASSFIVPTCNPDHSKWGQGFFARLTGANAEMLNMFAIMFMGERLFSYEGKTLSFALSPKLSAEFFDEKNEVSFLLFGKTKVIYHNPSRIDLYKGAKLTYSLDGKRMEEVKGIDALRVREGKIKEIEAEVTPI